MKPSYVVTASVPPGNRLRQFHNDDPGSPRYLLMDPPSFRWAGFDLRTLDTPRKGPEESWEVANGDRKVIRLFNDGTLIALLAADESFLGWGFERAQFLRYPRINPVPAVEVHAAFTHLYAHVLQQMVKDPTEITLTLVLAGGVVGESRLFLTEYFKNFLRIDNPTRYLIAGDPMKATLTILPAQLRASPDRVAYLLTKAFVSMFDMPEDKIPFTRIVDGEREVDIDQIRALSGRPG